jgi:hypothetical protein
MELLNNRQKLIKLADSSKAGWRTVQEYTQHELASDEEDEKRIMKAEFRAEKKMKEEKKARSSRRSNSYPPIQELARASETTRTSGAESSKRPGTCFRCGSVGHWAKECPKKESGSKLSYTLKYSESKVFNLEKNEQKLHKSPRESEVNENVSPIGRLKSHLTKWKEINANKYILDVIEKGYRIPFKDVPESVHLKNNRSARDNCHTVSIEIQKLIDKGCVTEVKDKPFVVNPLTLAFNALNKPRLVLDCRHSQFCIQNGRCQGR